MNIYKPLWIVLHGSAELYGSDKVLLNTMSALGDDPEFTPVIVLHEDGPLRRALESQGLEVHIRDVTKISRAMFSFGGLLRLPGQLLATTRGLKSVAAGRQIGLIYSNTLAVFGGAAWAKLTGLPHLWHVHEILERPAVVRRGLPWLACQFSDQAIANSTQTKAWLERAAPCLRGRVTVVFNGLGAVPQPDAEASAAARAAMGAADRDVLVTVVGRVNAWKGQGLLIDAVRRLFTTQRADRLRVAIVGDVVPGQESIREGLIRQVLAAGLENRVRFLPFIENIWPVWHGSDIAVVPSTQPEPFGMVAIEAMACGLPVVAAAHGGLLDIVEDGVTGLLFRPSDADALSAALAHLYDDSRLRALLGAAGARRQARHFSLDMQVAQTRAAGLALMRR